MSVTFKCKTSGVTVTFVDQVDIDSMKGHPEYDVVEAEKPAEITEEPKKLGRSKKADTE
jgi:hypothetical protein